MNLQGIYIGKVINKLDPNERDAIFCRIINMHDMTNEDSNNGIWVEDGISREGKSGNAPPSTRNGNQVYVVVMFVNNDPNKAFYFGEIKYNIEE